jgi:hypothetical protein
MTAPENVSEKVMVLPMAMSNVAKPGVLIGGTSFSPARFAEKSSVADRAVGAAKRVAVNAAKVVIF